MPGAIVGGANDYFGYIEANNNDAADRFTIVSGSLPLGLTMPTNFGVADTVIEGDATQVGTFTFVVHAADPNGGLSSKQTYRITADMLLRSADANGAPSPAVSASCLALRSANNTRSHLPPAAPPAAV